MDIQYVHGRDREWFVGDDQVSWYARGYWCDGASFRRLWKRMIMWWNFPSMMSKWSVVLFKNKWCFSDIWFDIKPVCTDQSIAAQNDVATVVISWNVMNEVFFFFHWDSHVLPLNIAISEPCAEANEIWLKNCSRKLGCVKYWPRT